LDVLERAGMTDCKPCSTPVDTHAKLSATAGDLVSDATHYRSPPVLCSISPSLARTYHMPSSRSVYTCMPLGILISRLSSEYCGIFGARCTMAFFYVRLPPLSLWSTRTLIGLGVRTLASQLLDMLFSWVAT
jgi:hypothetical protein